MIYAVLAYHAAGIVETWSAEEDAALMTIFTPCTGASQTEGKLGPAARLGPTARAFTLRGAGEGVVIDGPFAETKEELLGFYVLGLRDPRGSDRSGARSPPGQSQRGLRAARDHCSTCQACRPGQS